MATSKLRSVIESLANGKPVIVTDDPFDEGVFDRAAYEEWLEKDEPRVIAEAERLAKEKGAAIIANRAAEETDRVTSSSKFNLPRNRYAD